MIIRKKFKFESAHIVRNCTSQRCKENIHGHSYIVEVFVKGNQLDNGFMVLDFCLFKPISELIDSFDHSYCLWKEETQAFKDFICRFNQRVIQMPVSPSAEGFALIFFFLINQIIEQLELTNGEGVIKLHSVRVHETATGYAEAFAEDMEWAIDLMDKLFFSEAIRNEWNELSTKSLPLLQNKKSLT